jgi:hypothetical protein
MDGVRVQRDAEVGVCVCVLECARAQAWGGGGDLHGQRRFTSMFSLPRPDACRAGWCNTLTDCADWTHHSLGSSSSWGQPGTGPGKGTAWGESAQAKRCEDNDENCVYLKYALCLRTATTT